MTADPSFAEYKPVPRVPKKPADYEASCVTEVSELLGLAIKCEKSSGTWQTAHAVDVWMADHTKKTGHTRYRRALADFVDSGAAEAPARSAP
ncbi:hypothetical protein [Streptomyces sp. NPDC056244]|uniref:DUF7848 domain-containing protein n=1 Tax=Streptomyces sp. NPDC056244 TaxID=3345762 RepID=UPI0035D91899